MDSSWKATVAVTQGSAGLLYLRKYPEIPHGCPHCNAAETLIKISALFIYQTSGGHFFLQNQETFLFSDWVFVQCVTFREGEKKDVCQLCQTLSLVAVNRCLVMMV